MWNVGALLRAMLGLMARGCVLCGGGGARAEGKRDTPAAARCIEEGGSADVVARSRDRVSG